MPFIHIQGHHDVSVIHCCLDTGHTVVTKHGMGSQAMVAGDHVSSMGSAGILGAILLGPVSRPPQAGALSLAAAMEDGEETALWSVSPVSQAPDWYGVEVLGICYISPPASVRFCTVRGLVCFQASDWLSSMANRNTGVSRMRAAKVVASLQHVVTLHAHGLWTSLMDEDVRSFLAWDDGVTMVTRGSRPWFPMQTHALVAIKGPGQHVYAILGGVWLLPHCRLDVLLEYTGYHPEEHAPAAHGQEVEGPRTLRMGPLIFLCSNICPGSPSPISVGIWTPMVLCHKNWSTWPTSSPQGRLSPRVVIQWAGASVRPWCRCQQSHGSPMVSHQGLLKLPAVYHTL